MIAFLNFSYLVLLIGGVVGSAVFGFLVGKERGRNEITRDLRRARERARERAAVREMIRRHAEFEVLMEDGGLRLETPRPQPRRHGHGDRAHPPH